MLERNSRNRFYHWKWVKVSTTFTVLKDLNGMKWRYHIRLQYVLIVLASLLFYNLHNVYVSSPVFCNNRYLLASPFRWRTMQRTFGSIRTEDYWIRKNWFSRSIFKFFFYMLSTLSHAMLLKALTCRIQVSVRYMYLWLLNLLALLQSQVSKKVKLSCLTLVNNFIFSIDYWFYFVNIS